MLSLSLVKTFRGPGAAFCLNVTYDIAPEGGCAVLFGPSGSGKTLTLQCIAGLSRPDAGFIRVAGRTLYQSATGLFVPVQQRRIGYMLQDYALFPHLTLLQNVAFARAGLLPFLLSRVEHDRARALLDRFGLGHLAQHYPAQLSGGQKQRAALARALNAGPELLLLDEPFSALDPLLRDRLRRELAGLLAELSIPVLIITHDPDDVDAFTGKLVLYSGGRARLVDEYARIRADFSSTGACLKYLQTNLSRTAAA